MKKLIAMASVAAALIAVAPAAAQTTPDPAAYPVEQEDDDFPLGLLGLLGLAGLLGLKRRDDRDRVGDTRRP